MVWCQTGNKLLPESMIPKFAGTFVLPSKSPEETEELLNTTMMANDDMCSISQEYAIVHTCYDLAIIAFTLQGNIPVCVLSIVPDDGLSQLGAWTSAGTVMITFESYIYSGQALEGWAPLHVINSWHCQSFQSNLKFYLLLLTCLSNFNNFRSPKSLL